ncbi:MAG: CTP synthase [Deltaproteobacteria bacterium]|nr:CTP synthase [Deltaproteobacteria bacterium]
MSQRPHRTKYIFVTGGVVSSLGKGLAAGSIGALMEARGLKVTMLKLDPYINVDPGTMSPFQHGEVYVTDDGAETDLDLGHYERYTQGPYGRKNSLTTGKIYNAVIQKERRGEYLGQTVQVIPHITDEIKANIRAAAEGADIAICEIGGTVGDIESLPFLEAIRQMRFDEGQTNTLYVHLTLVPYIKAAGELKTKPTQHSVQKLREIGIMPDVLLCRCEVPLERSVKDKIALFTNVAPERVLSAADAEVVYEVPMRLHEEGLDTKICEILNIWSRKAELDNWTRFVDKVKNPTHEVKIGIVGKYVGLKESYKSLTEAIVHGGVANDARVVVEWIDAADIEKNGAANILGGLDGILVPGGFGERGTEGKILAVQFAREQKIPYFGICLGLQIATIEFARNVCKLDGANSTELDKNTAHPVVAMMNDQHAVVDKGGTMRLGSYICKLGAGTRAREIYGRAEISERHRHRYEVNNAYREKLEGNGLTLSGVSPDNGLVEMIELKDHPYFVACQFHPEFKSKPFSPHPLFSSFVNAALKQKQVEPRRGASTTRSEVDSGLLGAPAVVN